MAVSRQDMELYRLWQVDDGISAATSLDWEHRLIHEGRMYRYHTYFTLALTGDVKRFLMVANAGWDSHFRVEFSSDQRIDLSLYHSPTLTSNGTDVTSGVFNRKLGTTMTVHSAIYEDPVPTANGTMIDGYISDKGLLTATQAEFELEPGNVLMAVFTAQKDAQIVHASIDFYEEPE